jgi:hypothetical protein
MHDSPITVLAGGVGGARFLQGVVEVVPSADVVVVGNVGDDVEPHGLHVSPDLDTVLYTLTGWIDEDKGWGVRGDSDRALERARSLGADAWFWLGDLDIGLHLARTEALRQGEPLSAVEMLAHQVEGVLGAASRDELELSPALFDLLFAAVDNLSAAASWEPSAGVPNDWLEELCTRLEAAQTGDVRFAVLSPLPCLGNEPVRAVFGCQRIERFTRADPQDFHFRQARGEEAGHPLHQPGQAIRRPAAELATASDRLLWAWIPTCVSGRSPALSAASEPTVTMVPLPRSSMPGSTAWVRTYTAVRLTAITLSHS